MTFPITVRPGTSLPAWNVRRMPLFAIVSGFSPVMSDDSNRIDPASGLSRPVTQLKKVVFPEPFGPMMPWIVPFST